MPDNNATRCKRQKNGSYILLLLGYSDEVGKPHDARDHLFESGYQNTEV